MLDKDMDHNEMKLGAVHRYAGIYLTAEENSGKLQLGGRLTKTITIHQFKRGPFLPNEFTQHVMKEIRNCQYVRMNLTYLSFSFIHVPYKIRDHSLIT